MTGIAGVIYPDVFHIHKFMDPILDSMSHRSPGMLGKGLRDVYSFKNVSIGISGGVIAANGKKSIIAALDGAVYNYEELSKSLQKEGYEFATMKHSELFINAFDAWGEDFVEKIDGDFAAVVYDVNSGTLYLYRDRVGVKPLYWYFDLNHFIFASEIKAMLATGTIPQTPANDSIAFYLALGYIPQDMTPIQNVNKLLPAHYLKFSKKSGVSIHSYWSYGEKFQQKKSEPIETTRINLDYLLKQSVKKRLEPNITPGCLISGGIGSASVAHYIRQERPLEEIPAFTVGFQGQNDADITAASGFSQSLHLNQTIGIITPKTLLDDFVKIIWYLDEPLADPNVVATYNLGKIASSQSQYVYSGMGSDELLAGHGRYTLSEQESIIRYNFVELWHTLLRNFIVPACQWIDHKSAFNILQHSQSNVWEVGYIRHNSIFSEEMLNSAAPWISTYFQSDFFVQKFHNLSKIQSHTSSFLYLDFKTRLPDLYIAQFERLTMASGLQWRAPYLDSAIIDYLAGFPEPSSLSEKDTASILKGMFTDTFPNELIYRPKKTRKKFLSSWVKEAGLQEVFQCLNHGSLVESGIIDPNWIKSVTDTPENCEKYFPNLWALLTLEVWFRLFINFPIEPSCPKLSLQELLTKT